MNQPIVAYALRPGLPRPQTCGSHFEVHLRHIQQHGQTKPILVDRDGVVWSGQTEANILFDLGIEPVTQVVEDGPAAALNELATRDLTVVETADLVRWVYELSVNFTLNGYAKRSEAVTAWFAEVLGKTRGYSSSYIEQYLRIARAPPEHRWQLADAENLCQAMIILRRLDNNDTTTLRSSKVVAPEPYPIGVEGTTKMATDLLERTKCVHEWSPESRDALIDLARAIIEQLQQHASAN